MVNKHVVDKTVSGHESLFTGLFVFLLYADSRQERVMAALSFSAEDTTLYFRKYKIKTGRNECL